MTSKVLIRIPPECRTQLDELKRKTGASIQFSVIKAVRAYLQLPDVKATLKRPAA